MVVTNEDELSLVPEPSQVSDKLHRRWKSLMISQFVRQVKRRKKFDGHPRPEGPQPEEESATKWRMSHVLGT